MLGFRLEVAYGGWSGGQLILSATIFKFSMMNVTCFHLLSQTFPLFEHHCKSVLTNVDVER